MDDGVPIGLTSAGCQCDPQAKCALQGRSFTWCRVGGARCSLLRPEEKIEHPNDPALRDHDLYESGGPDKRTAKGLERTGAVWDYCIPKLGLEPGAGQGVRTAHGGICAWRGDILKRYETDETYLKKDGSLDLEKVPSRDRLSVDVMLQYRKDPTKKFLCTHTEQSGHFLVCPVTADTERPEFSGRGWNATHSWDFCTEGFWKPVHIPKRQSEALPDPEAPVLGKRAPLPPEEPRGSKSESPREYPDNQIEGTNLNNLEASKVKEDRENAEIAQNAALAEGAPEGAAPQGAAPKAAPGIPVNSPTAQLDRGVPAKTSMLQTSMIEPEPRYLGIGEAPETMGFRMPPPEGSVPELNNPAAVKAEEDVLKAAKAEAVEKARLARVAKAMEISEGTGGDNGPLSGKKKEIDKVKVARFSFLDKSAEFTASHLPARTGSSANHKLFASYLLLS